MDIKKELALVYKKARLVLTSPQRFFEEFKEKGKRGAVVYWVILAIVNFLASYVLRLIAGRSQEASALLFLPVAMVVSVALLFVFAGLLHLWFKLFGAKGNYEKSLVLLAYSATPSHLLGWVPVVGGFMFIWQLALLLIGSMELHKLSRRRALLALGLLFVVFLVLLVVASVVFIRIAGHLLG